MPDNTPPICPGCNVPLEDVDYYEYAQWTFNAETGGYECTMAYGGTAETKCSHCNCTVDEQFPEGPVNYGHQRKV